MFTIAWGFFAVFVMIASPPVGTAKDSSSAIRQTQIREFLEEEIECDRYVFPPGRLPSVRWKRPESVRLVMGEIPLSVEYVDRAGQTVTRADKPGRYGAVVRGKTSGGFLVVRHITLYCAPIELDDYSPIVPLSFVPLPDLGIGEKQWSAYQKNLRKYSFGSLLLAPKHDPDAAVFLAGLSELDPDARPMDTPRLVDRKWWLEFKRQRDGARRMPVTLSVERFTEKNNTAAGKREAHSSSYKAEHLRLIRRVCSTWADSAHEPMVTHILHNGRIVMHEPFGASKDGRALATTTPTWMASITKLLTGVLVMQCVDRGLVDLDTPLDRYLPELASTTPCPLTLRHCMTHTTGLAWAGEWASDWNPSMENGVAQAIPYLEVGKSFKYHRAGYALASKVLERITGLPVPYLFDTMILKPLGMEHSYADNSYGGLYATAEDLAHFGEMLLNRGTYGKYRLLTDRAFATLLPAPLKTSGKDAGASWGIGCAPLGGHGLSKSTFGHEAASGAILRIDPEHNLVVVVGRNKVGPDYKQYERFMDRFLNAVSSPWEHAGRGE